MALQRRGWRKAAGVLECCCGSQMDCGREMDRRTYAWGIWGRRHAPYCTCIACERKRLAAVPGRVEWAENHSAAGAAPKRTRERGETAMPGGKHPPDCACATCERKGRAARDRDAELETAMAYGSSRHKRPWFRHLVMIVVLLVVAGALAFATWITIDQERIDNAATELSEEMQSTR